MNPHLIEFNDLIQIFEDRFILEEGVWQANDR